MDSPALLASIDRCRLCAGAIPDPIRPVLQFDPEARILVAGQAPGRKVQASGVPFDDASGDRLRDWMGVSRATFYDPAQIAILPMAFCYPGKGQSGDLPPPPICAETWRERLMAGLPNLRLTLLVGRYAQAWHIKKHKDGLTETVKAWRDYAPDRVPLPHPSPRNNIWLKRHPWFGEELLPDLARRVAAALR